MSENEYMQAELKEIAVFGNESCNVIGRSMRSKFELFKPSLLFVSDMRTAMYGTQIVDVLDLWLNNMHKITPNTYENMK